MSRKRLNVNRFLSRIAERVAQAVDGVVQSMIEVDESIRWPKPLTQLLPCNDLASMLQKDEKVDPAI
jgi:hypothetical protein